VIFSLIFLTVCAFIFLVWLLMSLIVIIALLKHGFLSPFVWIAVILYFFAVSAIAASFVFQMLELNPFSSLPIL